MSVSSRMRVGAVLIAAFALLVSGCAGGAAESEGDASAADTGASDAQTSENAEGDGEYAFGTDRDAIAEAIETAFSSSNGSTHWEGDTLVLAVDGDAESAMAGFTECRVLAELLNEGDGSVIDYPNGRIDCTEVLADS